jgi:hypothetical protein
MRERREEWPTLSKSKRERVGHPKAFFRIKARPPADSHFPSNTE